MTRAEWSELVRAGERLAAAAQVAASLLREENGLTETLAAARVRDSVAAWRDAYDNSPLVRAAQRAREGPNRALQRDPTADPARVAHEAARARGPRCPRHGAAWDLAGALYDETPACGRWTVSGHGAVSVAVETLDAAEYAVYYRDSEVVESRLRRLCLHPARMPGSRARYRGRGLDLSAARALASGALAPLEPPQPVEGWGRIHYRAELPLRAALAVACVGSTHDAGLELARHLEAGSLRRAMRRANAAAVWRDEHCWSGPVPRRLWERQGNRWWGGWGRSWICLTPEAGEQVLVEVGCLLLGDDAEERHAARGRVP